MSKNQEGVISDVDYMLEAAGLPSYSLLQRSCAEATKFVLSITREPRTAQLVGIRPDMCEDCKRTVTGMQSCCPFHYVQDNTSSKTALTLLRPQPSETISQWAVRYVEAMLAD